MEIVKNDKGLIVVNSEFKIISLNKTFKEWYPNAKVGLKCYKACHGFNAPCPNCRIVSKDFKDKIMLNPNTGTWINSCIEAIEMENQAEGYSIAVFPILHTDVSEDDNDSSKFLNSYYFNNPDIEKGIPQKEIIYENQHLLEITDLWNTALNNMPNGYHRCDNDKYLTLLNVSERFCEIVGYTKDELHRFFDNKYINLIHPDDLEQFMTFMKEINMNEKNAYAQCIYRILSKKGYIWVLDTTKFVVAGGTRSAAIAFYQGAITDVSNIMGSHQKDKEKLLSTTNKVNQYKKALVSGANVIYEVNVSKDILEVANFYKGDEELSLGSFCDTKIPCPYTKYLPLIVNRVAEDERSIFYETNSLDYFKRCFNQGVLKWQLEYDTLSAEDEHLHMRKHYILTQNEITGDIHALIVAKDLTKEDQFRKENEYNLKKQKRELASALTQAEQRLKVIDGLCNEYHIVFYVDVKNDLCIPYVIPEEEEYKYKIGEFHDTPFSKLIVRYITSNTNEDERQELFKKTNMDVVLNELENKDTYQINYKIRRDNEIDHSQVRIVKIDDNKYEQVWAFRSIEHIVQEERKQQKYLQDLLIKTRKAEQAKTTFLLNMSHDIRTPMNAIIGFNTIAKDNLDNKQEALNALEKSDIASHHLLNLINEVLEMARIESNKIEIHTKMVSVKDYFSQIEEMFSLSMKEKNINFKTNYMYTVPYVLLDETRVMQVITNLLGNAMKFTPSGGNILFSVKETCKGEECLSYEIIVQDTGIGMSEEFQKKLFNAFEREENPTTSHIDGTGLGLAISKNIAEMLGGSLNCISHQGQGSTFIFRFRCNIANNAEQIKEFKNCSTKVQINPVICANKRILLVEDNELNLEIAIKIITRYGFKVESAQNGAIAVDMIKNSKPGYYDLVLMDIQMPVMDGYTATKNIRNLENQELATIPIVAMTANAFDEDRQKALDVGMNGHLSKPINIKKLLELLQKTVVLI